MMRSFNLPKVLIGAAFALATNSGFYSMYYIDTNPSIGLQAVYTESMVQETEKDKQDDNTADIIQGIEMKEERHAPRNIHKGYGFECGKDIDMTRVSQASYALFEMNYGYKPGKLNGMGHRGYKGPMEKGLHLLTKYQICNYAAIEKFRALTVQYNMTRWSAHGGSLMAARCHSSINPWDDDIDITVSSCEGLEKIFAQAGNITARYPEIEQWRHTAQGWVGRLVDDDWILIRGPKGRQNAWFKLKSVVQTQSSDISTSDLAGTDIMCFDHFISKDEKAVMKRTGFEDYLKGDQPLQEVEYGPTMMKLVPNDIVDKYVLDRYGKSQYCDFPMDKTNPAKKKNLAAVPHRSSQILEALSKYYYSKSKRKRWLEQIGEAKGNDINQEIVNLNHVEIDNSIARADDCQFATPGRPLKVIGFNAERGTYWDEFATMVESMPELEKPDLVILNEMDIGMARSGNVHTARKLAFRLGMNYAWGLEFIELTNGNREEQAATEGMENSMGLHGNAVLSKCPIYDPLLVRDKLDERYFSHTKFKGNDMGSEKRLGGRMALFVRTGAETNKESPHVVAGSVHKVQPTTQRQDIWEYLGFGPFPNVTSSETPGMGMTPDYTIGIVTSGDMESRQFCPHTGLKNLDKPQKQKTFPADCATDRLGNWRGDQFCGSMKIHREDRSFLPCFVAPGSNATALQISDHSIIEVSLTTSLY